MAAERLQRTALTWRLGLLGLVLMLLGPVMSEVLARWVVGARQREVAALEESTTQLRASLIRVTMSLFRFALTGEPRHREDARRALAEATGVMDEVSRHAGRVGPEAQALAAELRGSINRWVREVVRPLLSGDPGARERVIRQSEGRTGSSLAVWQSYARLRDGTARAQRVVVAQEAGIRATGLLLMLSAGVIVLLAGAREVRAREALTAARAREEAERTRLAAVLENIPAGVLVVEGRTLERANATANPAYQEIHGQRLPTALRVVDAGTIYRYYEPDRRTPVPPEDLPGTRAMETGETIRQRELHLCRPDGEWRVVLDTAAPLRDARGEIAGAVVALQDITARYDLERENVKQRTYLDAVLHQVPHALFILDEEGRTQKTNHAGRRLSPPDAEARHLSLNEVVAAIHPRTLDGRPIPLDELPGARALRGEGVEGEVILVRCPETGVDAYETVSAAPLRDAEGRVFGAVVAAADVSDRVRIEHELSEASETKDRFVAVVSHELRNPLTPLMAGIEVLRRSAENPERVRSVADIMDRNVKLQARLVNDLLDISRIARGKLELRRERMDLGAVAQRAVDAIRPDADAAGLALESRLASGLWVEGDPDRLQQVVMNLLTNAVKFTPAGGRIRVQCSTFNVPRSMLNVGRGTLNAHREMWNVARLEVEDTGAGIAPELMPHLFEMFRQGGDGAERKAGLGIGLALVKSLVEIHGGRVWAESEGPGKGSRFTVELPLTKV
ncbi:MAG: PAS domain-containing protein [Armatimonadetes bacterium]|nr:PAS domain-containing protein [Armatimonadota bacterium]